MCFSLQLVKSILIRFKQLYRNNNSEKMPSSEPQHHHSHTHNHHHHHHNHHNHQHQHCNHHPHQTSRSVPYMDVTVKEIFDGGYNISRVRRIGSGYSSVVSMCLYRATSQDPGKIIALKTIMKEKPKISTLALSEIALLRKCRDKNVLHFESAVECRDAFIIITEYCGKGDMFTNLKYLDDVKLVREYMVGILRGIAALHSRLVAHCDIKMKNILITEDNVIKLADFGFAVQLRTANGKIDVLNGTQDYWAPEMDIVPPCFNPLLTDIYALAVTFVGMLEKRAIKRKNDDIHQIVCGYKDIYQRQMLQGMLEKSPDDRWTLAQIQNNEWLNDVTPPPSPT